LKVIQYKGQFRPIIFGLIAPFVFDKILFSITQNAMSKLDKKFVVWFYDEVYAEPNYNRNGWMREHSDMQNPDHRNFWMREAYLAGALEGRRQCVERIKLEMQYHLNEGNHGEASDLGSVIYMLENTSE
jgi:hypothetical protein